MNYWINIDGVQSGPLSIEELKAIDLNDENVYVWCEGMADWERACDCAELKDLIQPKQNVAEPVAEAETEPKVTSEPEEVPEIPVPTVETETPAEEGEPEVPEIPAANPVAEQQLNADAATPEVPRIVYVQQPKPCPPTNLVWGILTTVLCCTVFGVVSIVYATQVTNAYNDGNYEKAYKCSERAAGWAIASIVISIILQPFSALTLLFQ